MWTKFAVIGMLTIALGGCATYSGWTPTVDAYNSPNAYRLQQDLEECRQLARQAGGVSKESLLGGAAGGLVGAAAGAAIGAAVGSPGTGAAIGAAAGGIGGAAKQGTEGDDNYKRAYANCLRGRGHKVLN